MLEKVIKRKLYLQKHLDAPLLYERESYLEKLAERGLTRDSLKCIADYQIVIIQMLSLNGTPGQEVRIEEILKGSENWANLITNHPMKRKVSPSTDLVLIYLLRAIGVQQHSHSDFYSDFAKLVLNEKSPNSLIVILLVILQVVPPEPEFLNEYK